MALKSNFCYIEDTLFYYFDRVFKNFSCYFYEVCKSSYFLN